MVKHPAWAAAMSSSGFVPGPFSNRVVKEYGALFRTPPGAESVPLPDFRSPFQTADAVRFIVFVGNGQSVAHCRANANAGEIGSQDRPLPVPPKENPPG